jgi:tripartite-type tricarboxylate transporter receptor subunit TctC
MKALHVSSRSGFAAATLLLVQSGIAQAQNFPDKPVRIVIGFPAGTSVDIVGRVMGQKLGEIWGQPAVVDNRAGAGGNIAADFVAKAAPDGHALFLSNNGIAISATLYRKLPYDALRDLVPVTQVTSLPHVLVANKSLPANSIKELIALAKSKPGQLSFGSGGTGNSDHMAGELFKFMTGVDLVHVPYKGGNQALTDTVSGQVAMYFSGVAAALPLLKAGKAKALGTSGTRRSPALPDVPTIAEAGVPGYEVNLWNGLFAPAGTPEPVIAKIAADTGRALKLPDVQERFAVLGLETAATGHAEFQVFFKSEVAKWAKVIKVIGITAD